MKKVLLYFVITLSLTSCISEVLDGMSEGQPVGFAVATEYVNLPETKTEYSGVDENGNTVTGASAKERINWVDTDLIRIYSDVAFDRYSANHYADYAITPGTNSGAVSNASITPATGNGLVWGAGSHNFYAVYPAPGTKWKYDTTQEVGTADVSITGSGSSAEITGSIPAAQTALWNATDGEYEANMNDAYMYAVKTGVSSGATVDLAFKPLVTTFEVILKAGGTDAVGMKLKSVEIVSGNATLSGDFTATVSAAGISSVSKSNAGSSVKITIPDGEEPTLNTSDELKFTLLSLPVDQTQLTLVLTLLKGTNPVQRTLELRESGNWITVPAGKKLYVWGLGVPANVWHYTIEDIPDIVINGHLGGRNASNMRSYRSSDSGLTQEYVDVKFQYSTDGVTYSDDLPTGLTSLNKNSGSTAIERKLTAIVDEYSVVDRVTQRDDIVDHAKRMRDRTPKGSSEAPYDLSMHTITGETRTKPVTANSYIVDAPGTYMFPLVYGNAIDGIRSSNIDATAVNGGNRAAYQSTSSDSPLTSYVRFDGNTIKRPYILWDIANGGVTPGGTSVGEHDNNYLWSNYELVVVWQDVPAAEAIISQPVDISQKAGNTLGDCVIYAVFTVDPTTVNETTKFVKGARQGNFVIALRTKKAITVAGHEWPRNTIIWSWHIWVTDNDMTPIRVKTNYTAGTAVRAYNDMLPYHLGWCDENVHESTFYKDRSWYVKATQVKDGVEHASKVFKVVQKGDEVINLTRYSAATCYQWGRKDPMLPGFNTYRGGTHVPQEDFQSFNKPWSSPAGYNIVGGTEGYLVVSDHAMSIPELIREPYVYNRNGVFDRNLWNRNADTEWGHDLAVRKTIYDPCPPRYSIPHMHAFSNFYKGGTATVVNGEHHLDQINAKDIDGDGVITRNDFEQEDGWYFYTGYGDNTIFFGGTTGRLSSYSYVQYYHEGYIWTAARDWRDESSPAGNQNGGFDFHYTPTCAFPWISATNHALTVRPVAE